MIVPFVFSASPAVPPIVTVPPVTVPSPAPADVILKPGETIARTIPSEIAMIPPAYVIRTADGRIVISWRTARTIPYDTIALGRVSGVEAIKFVDGSLRFRVTRGSQTFFVVQVLERPETGLMYLMAEEAETMHLSILMKEQEVPCLEVITTVPTDDKAVVGYVVEVPPASQPGFANFRGAPVDGTPDHLALLPTRDLLLVEFRSDDGSKIDTWLQTPASP